MKFLRRNMLPIGIDIGSHSVKLLQLKTEAGGFAVHAASELPIHGVSPDDPKALVAAAVAAMKPIIATGQFAGRRCVAAVPAAQVHTRTMRLPKMPDAELQQAIYWEAKDRFGFDIDTGRLVHFPSGEVRRGTESREEYLLFATVGDLLDTIVRELCAIELEPVALDLQPCALERIARHGLGSQMDDAVRVVVDIGTAGTQIVFFRHQYMVFYKYIPIGGRHFDAAAAQKLNVSLEDARALRTRLRKNEVAASDLETEQSGANLQQVVSDAIRPTVEELAKEMELCLRYCAVSFRGSRVAGVHLVGGESYAPFIAQTLSGALSVPTTKGGFFETLCPGSAELFPAGSGEWHLAAGLSLYTADSARRRAGVAA